MVDHPTFPALPRDTPPMLPKAAIKAGAMAVGPGIRAEATLAAVTAAEDMAAARAGRIDDYAVEESHQ